VRLRQVALVARDLDSAVGDLCGALGLEVCHRDPGVGHFGLHNALMPVGDAFIEVVSPLREGTTAGRYLDRRGGDGGYMLLLQVDDLAHERRRLDDLGVRIVWSGDGDGISGMHLHPADVGGAIVSFDVATPPESWGWAGPDWRAHVRDGRVRDIAAVEVQADDPRRLAERWAAVLDRPVSSDGEAWHLALDHGAVRFVAASDGRGDGIGGIDLVASDRNSAGTCASVCGVRIRMV
jgi:Glyoxalase-like domain